MSQRFHTTLGTWQSARHRRVDRREEVFERRRVAISNQNRVERVHRVKAKPLRRQHARLSVVGYFGRDRREGAGRGGEDDGCAEGGCIGTRAKAEDDAPAMWTAGDTWQTARHDGGGGVDSWQARHRGWSYITAPRRIVHVSATASCVAHSRYPGTDATRLDGLTTIDASAATAPAEPTLHVHHSAARRFT